MVTTFIFRGRIADIDETTCDEPFHPTIALIVEAGDVLTRVVVPNSVLRERLPLLCAGRPIEIAGEVAASRCAQPMHHVASDLKLSSFGH